MFSWSYNHCCIYQWCGLWAMGVFRNVPNLGAVVTLFKAVGFGEGFNTKICWVGHIMIVVYINGVGYRGSSEMSQIHVLWWHFSEVIGYYGFWWCFTTKVCSVDHIIIAVYINGVGYMGSSEMSQIHVLWSHFWRQLVTVDFDDVSLQKYVQLII